MIFDYMDYQWIYRFFTKYGYSKSGQNQVNKHLKTQRISDFIEEEEFPQLLRNDRLSDLSSFISEFSKLRLFHGTRCIDKSDFLKEGIRIPSDDLFLKLCNRAWPHAESLGITEALIKKLIRDQNRLDGTYPIQACLLIDKRHHFAQEVDFVSGGSETLRGLCHYLSANNLELSYSDLRQDLVNLGMLCCAPTRFYRCVKFGKESFCLSDRILLKQAV